MIMGFIWLVEPVDLVFEEDWVLGADDPVATKFYKAVLDAEAKKML